MAGQPEAERNRLFQEAAIDFAVDFNSFFRVALPPLDTQKRARRKDARRRKRSVNPTGRYLAANWEAKGLYLLTAAELAKHMHDALSREVTPAAIRKIRQRLNLFVPWVGRPQRPP